MLSFKIFNFQLWWSKCAIFDERQVRHPFVRQMANMRWNINAFLEVHLSSLSFGFFSSVGTDNEDLKLLQMWVKVLLIISMTLCWEVSVILNKSFSSKTYCATDLASPSEIIISMSLLTTFDASITFEAAGEVKKIGSSLQPFYKQISKFIQVKIV